ncbi:MAG: class I SAM-dependent methyltransferase [Gammaproteobacteria bacterium]
MNLDDHVDHASRHNELINLIRAEGIISFARYMELALYAPGLGYYSAGLRKFGPGGDFVTAPEISPLFSRCIAKQCAQISGDVLELGAGTGTMAAEILRHYTPNHYYILEVSADLKQRQQETLKNYSNVTWLTGIPETFTGIILANEVLDALPVHRFRIHHHHILEAYVRWENDTFTWHYDTPTSPGLLEAVKELNLASDYESEIHLTIPPFINTLGTMLKKGVILFIDYGFSRAEYYHPQRNQGTLMCHYQHRSHPNPLILTGQQDITAHIDFTALGEAAIASGFHVKGYTTQAAFLLALGLLDHHSPDPAKQLAISQQIQKLIQPHEMGELFKAMAFTKNFDQPLLGFSLSREPQ